MSFNSRSILILITGTVLGISLSLGGGVLAERGATSQRDSLPWDEARLLAEVLERVKQEYVEPVEDSDLIESAVRGMVTNLDPHSQFLDSDEYEEIRISTTGNYTGVGLEVNMTDGIVTVVAPIDGTPAAQAGLRPGDRIISVDDIDVDEKNLSETIGLMRGKPGSKVRLEIARDGEAKPLEFTLTRSQVQVRSIRAELLESDYGYLRITHFSETTMKDLRKAVAELKSNNPGRLKGVVLDLRNNPGGVLDAAVEVSDAFLDSGVIVKASGRGRDANFMRSAKPGDLLEGVPMVVMVNEGSASASEIVAGALHDNSRATVVGRQTVGKGSVQTVMPLSNGRAIKLTTSRYFTPLGVSIQGQGITPDIVLDDGGLEDLMAGAAEHHTEAGAALLQSDAQLRRTLELLKGDRILQSKAE